MSRGHPLQTFMTRRLFLAGLLGSLGDLARTTLALLDGFL